MGWLVGFWDGTHFSEFFSEIPLFHVWYIRNSFLIFPKKVTEISAMWSIPKPHQPPRGAYFDTLTVLYQNEKYWPQAVFWQHILDLGYFMFSKVNILGKINIFRTCFVLQKWIWSSSLKKKHAMFKQDNTSLWRCANTSVH